MSPKDSESPLPIGLAPIAERLRAERPEAGPLELDRVKLNVLERTSGGASRGRTRARARFPVASRRAASIALAMALLAGGTGVFASSGGFKSGSTKHKSAASSQYKPGKGCGDKNHVHERENECKKPPK